MGKFIVISVCEREIESVRRCSGIEEAVDMANGLLKDHCAAIGCSNAYKKLSKDVSSHEIQKASITRDAWCNLKGTNWDAYIIDVDEGTER